MPLLIIDGRMPSGSSFANYVSGLAKGLSNIAPKSAYEVVFLTRPEQKIFDFRTIECNIPFLHPKEIFKIPSILKKNKADLYHSPSFSSLLYYPCPHIITVHDLNHLQFGNFAHKIYYNILLRKALLGAKTAVSVSQFSAAEIKRWIPRLTIECAYNPIEKQAELSPETESKILNKFKLQKNSFFFCLSNSKPHKNLDFLKSAYQKFSTTEKTPLPLVISTQSIAQSNGIHHIGFLNNEEMACLLKNCSAFFFPSLYEGFGRPPLEAALYEKALVVSKIPPHVEALCLLPENEKLLLSPKNETEWSNAFQLAQNKKLAPVSLASKNKILDFYSAASLAKKMDGIYKNALGLG